MFRTVLLSIITLMHVYVFLRAASVPFIRRSISRRMFIAAGIIMWTVLFLGLFFAHDSTGGFASILETSGMYWLGIVFLLTVSLLVVDIITGFGFVLRRSAPFLRGCALAAGVVLSVVAIIQALRPPVVQDYDVKISGLPVELDGTIVVAMSDLHAGSLVKKQWLEERVEQVDAQQPDFIVLLGDIFEGHGDPPDELIEVLGRLSAPMGVWAVLGNHEFHGRRGTDSSGIKFDGIKVLNDTWVELHPGLVLAGVDDLTTNHRNGLGSESVQRALAERPEGTTVILSHTPWYADKIAAEGVDLMLSGHTHGGQIWPFGYIVKQVYPLFEGRYEVDGMTVIVCRGTGTWGPRMRLWRRGEILRITLRSKEELKD